MKRTALALLILAAAACGRKPAVSGGPACTAPDIAKATFASSLAIDLSATQQTPRGVCIRDLTVGTGAEAVSGSQVSIHYVGTFIDGRQFDASGPNDPPLEFQVNAGNIIPGFSEGVVGMKAGGKRQVIIPPALGYGAVANGPIPANSILVFTIDLVTVR